MARPAADTYPPAFELYIKKVQEENISDALRNQQDAVDYFFDNIPEEKYDYAYATGKWTLKEMIQHIIDTERIFNYRCLCFSRREEASLPGFDENQYADNSNASVRTWEALVDEFKTVRKGTRYLFDSFSEQMLNHAGMANDKSATALSMGYATVGHLYHHIYIIETRYLDPAESC